MAAEVEDSDGVKCKQTTNDGKENEYQKDNITKDDPENKKESSDDKTNPSSDVALEAEERFRVDRKTLENLLKDDNNPESTGNNFFQRIEHATNTTITWPSKLKIGAKSKKDPYIKVAGLPQDRQAAKQMVLSVMDTKSSRVTLKMDVSFTDHSHIIGKGGNTIKKVMQDTKCHIHFPDSNRTSSEKSNQVSIAGPPFCVESARRQIRELLPIMLKFEIPPDTVVLPDSSSPVITNIAQTHNVTISFQQNLRSFGYIGCVKGLHSDPFSVRDSVLKILEHLTGTVPVTVQVTTQMEVDPKHHEDLNGPNHCNIHKIQLSTGARIAFPSMHDPNARKSTITITGSIEATVTAKVYLLQFLPLILMFDIRDSENEEMLEQGMRNKLAETMNVMINVKPKAKQFCKSIIVKGYEKDASNIYKTRLHLIGEDPSSMPNLLGPLATLIIPSTNNTPLHLLNGIMPNNMMNKTVSPLSPPVQSSSPLVQQAPESSQQLEQQYLSISPVGQRIIGSEVKMMKRLSVDGLFGFGDSERVDNDSERKRSLDGLSNSRSAESILDALRNNQKAGLKDVEPLTSSGSWGGKGRTKLPTNQSSGSIDSGLSRSQEDLDSSVGVPLTANLLNNLAISRNAKLSTEDYELRKKLARDAMHSQVQYDRLRIPTNAWAGFGFSNSMPGAVIKELRNNKKIKRQLNGSPNPMQQHSPTTSLNSSASSNGSSNSTHSQGHQSPLGMKPLRRPPPGLEDSHPSSENSLLINNNYDYTSMLTPPPDSMLSNTYAHVKSIADLFSDHGLENYIEAFEKEEVDVATFMSLTDEDLKEIGVSTIGARKKMARLMKELQAYHNQQSLGYTPRIPSPLTTGMPQPLFSHRPTHNFDMAAHSLRW